MAALAVSASVPMVLGTVTWDGWGDAVVFACVAAGWGAFGGGLFSLGTAWAGMQRLPAGPAPLAAGALATASWILLRLWMDTLPVEPGVAGASAEYTRGGLGTIWTLVAPALAGMACAWRARWRRARDAASGPAAR